jgi:peptidoglycan/LPS O-acetylase OafA/YrhL
VTAAESAESPATLATHGSAAADREWFPVIEALRGIAAVGVVIDHCWALASGSPQFGFGLVQGLGDWGVDVFFLLSGYLLCDYFWRKDRRPSVREFYVRRFFRIAPLYYVVVGIVFLFYAEHSQLFSGPGLEQVIANATFTQWLTPGTASNLNVDGSLWTLTIEMLLYLTMPFLAWVIGRWPIWGTVGLAGLGLGYRLYVSLAGGPLADWYWGSLAGPGMGIERLFLVHQFLGILPLFALGMFARRMVLYTRFRQLVQRSKRKPSLVVVLVLLVPSVLVLWGVQRASEYTHWVWFTGFDLAVGVLALPVFVYASRPVVARLGRPMRSGVWVGERSYGLYLWHFPVILGVYGIGAEVNPPDLTNLPLRIVAIAVISTVLADVSYRFIELPGRRYGRRLGGLVRGSKPDVAPPAQVAGTAT